MAGVIRSPTIEALLSLDGGPWASFTQDRPNNATGYTANDVVGGSAGAAAGAATMIFDFNNPPYSRVIPGSSLMITGSVLRRDVTALISGETNYNLYLYSGPPPSALLDNAAFDIPAGDRDYLITKINLGTPVDEGSTLLVVQSSLNVPVRLAPKATALWGYLVTVGAYTPAASTVLKVTLYAAQL